MLQAIYQDSYKRSPIISEELWVPELPVDRIESIYVQPKTAEALSERDYEGPEIIYPEDSLDSLEFQKFVREQAFSD